ncbi:hypothetical protein FRC09_003852 [Ceratobasidium sp. 395]|nr:hypothetical protein FRC09_003852 [Ceratobasidium sp. 395]
MLSRIKDRMRRTKEKLRRFFAGHEPTTSVNQAPAIPSHERAQVNPPAAQPPPAVVMLDPGHPNRDIQTDPTPIVSIPANELSTASSPRPEPSQVGAASAQGLTAAGPVSETVSVQRLDTPPAVPNLHEREPRDVKDTVWCGVTTLLGVLKESSDAFGPLKSAVGGLSRCIEIFENAATARQEYAQLRTELNNICQDISGLFDGSAPPSMTPSIAILAQGIEKETEKVIRKSQRSTLERHAEAMEDIGEVLECYRRIQVLLNRLSLNANVNMWKIAEEQATQTRLKELPYSAEAKFKSAKSDSLGRNRCTPNTRVDVLQQLRIWAEDSESQRIYWLNGMAGTGKTTIAYSLCERLQDDGKLAASFFCSRQLPTCRDVDRILPSIAFQLSLFSLPFRHAVSSALQKYLDAHNQPVDLQFESLVAAPLREVRDTLPADLVIVVDALDECEDARGVSKMLFALLQNSLDLPMKVFVTSRPEQRILDRMESKAYRHLRSELRLHELERLVVQADIKTYLMASLDKLNLNIADLDSLTKQSGVLFVYASTVVRYVTDNPSRSSQRLAEVLATPASLDSSQLGVDPLYTAILQAALEDESLTRSERREVNQILRTVICAREPLSVNLIAKFLGINKVESVYAALRALSSVLQVSDTVGRLVTTLNQSFPDYMLDQKRSRRFCCEPEQYNAWYTQTCFSLHQENGIFL